MALDPIKNFAVGTITTGYDIDDVTIVLASGHGAYFPDPATEGAYNLVWWNSTDYKNPSLDPLKEIVRVTARTSDTLTVTRPASGNSYNGEGSDNVAHAHNITGRQYKFMLTPTKAYMAGIQTEINTRLSIVTVGFADATYICDGTSDEVQIQQAIDAVVADGGGWVYILPGTYDIRAKLDFSGNNVKLVGAGQNTTILKLNAAFSGFALIYDFTASLSNIEITGITFDANSIDGKGCMEIGTVTNLWIHHCEFKNVAHVAGNHWTVLIGVINDADIPGSASYNVVFEDNYVHDNNNGSNETVLPINCRDSRFDNNYFEANTNSAYTLNLFGYCNNCTVHGNVFRNTHENIYILSCENVSIKGNVAYGEASAQGFVRISNSERIDVSGNVFRAYRSGGIANNGIRIEDRSSTFDGHAEQFTYSRYVSIDNNVLYDCYYGISVANNSGIFDKYTASDITISNNKIFTTEWQAIHIGQNISTMDIQNIVIKNNYIGIGNFFDTGAIQIRGYTSDVTKVKKITIQGNKIMATARSNGAGININACSEIIIIDNDMEGTGKGTYAGQDLLIENSATYKIVKNNNGINPDKIYAQGNVTGATTFNRANGRVITATLTGNVTTTLTSGKADGDDLTLILTQDATGGRTLSIPSNLKPANGGTLILSVSANAVDVIKLVWDGTNWREVSRAIYDGKASGAEIDTGTDDNKFVTPKAIRDSGVISSAVAGEIAGVTEKTTVASADVFLIESNADSNAKRRLTLANLFASPTFTGTVTVPLTPSNATDAASKGYVDSVAQGLDAKPSAVVATAAALPAYTYANGASGVGATLTMNAVGIVTVDGRALLLGDVVLVKDETAGNAPYNGLYTVTTEGTAGVAAVLTRHTSMDLATEFTGAYIFVESGTVNTGAGFVCTNSSNPTVGSTAITFTQFSGAGQIIAGNGISKSANTLSIDTSVTVDLTTAQTLTNKTLTSPKINENVALTTTATKLNYLTSATGTTGTASTNIVFSTSPTLVTPNIGVATASAIITPLIYPGADSADAIDITKADGTTKILTVDTTNSRIGLLTTAPTHTLTFGSTSTGASFYNTSDQTTNYDRVRMQWSGNTFVLTSEAAGSGTTRDIRIGTTNTGLTIGNNDNAFAFGRSSGSATFFHSSFNGTMTNSSGTNTCVRINPTFNQTSTAGYVCLLINPTETATGSGAKNLADFQVGSVSKFKIDNFGHVTFDATITAGGTTGDRTINKPAGTVNIAAAGTTVTVTNSLCTTSSIVLAVIRTADTTATIKNVVPGSGSFVINLGAAATAEVSIGFVVIN